MTEIQSSLIEVCNEKCIWMLTMLLSVITFAACSSDDDDDNNSTSITETELIGTWDMTQVTVNGKSAPLNGTAYIIFPSDKTYHIVFMDYDYEVTWKLEGNTITAVTPDPVVETIRVTSISGKNVHIAYSNSDGRKMEIDCTKR